MRTIHPYTAYLGSALAFLLLFTGRVYADTTTDLFLSPVVVLNQASSTHETLVTDENLSASDEESGVGVTERTQVWVRIRALLETFRSRDEESDERTIRLSVAQVRIKDIGDTWAILSWPRNTFSNITVYYATTSPVSISNQTVHVSPWMLWNREHMTLRGLSPNTTYFYRVVTETSTGTTTSAEASFRTTQSK